MVLALRLGPEPTSRSALRKYRQANFNQGIDGNIAAIVHTAWRIRSHGLI